MANAIRLNAEQRKHRDTRAAVPPLMLGLLMRNDPELLLPDEQERHAVVRVPVYEAMQSPEVFYAISPDLDEKGQVLASALVEFNYPENNYV